MELILSVAAILLILVLARMGAVFGVFYELISALLMGLAMLVTLRYWYLATRLIEGWLPGSGPYGALGAYWTLFLVGCLPLILVMKRLTEDSVPRYPRLVDTVFGFLFGLLSATVLVCCVMTSLSVVLPKVWPPYNRHALLLPLDELPVAAYRVIERDWLAIPTTDPGHTRFPTFEPAQADDFPRYWQ